MKKPRILMVLGENQYGVLERFACELSEGFEKEGYLIDWLKGPITVKKIKIEFCRCKNRSYEFAFFFNASMMDFCDMFLKSPSTILWSFFVDPPLYHLERLQVMKQNVIVSFIDRNHLSYAKREFRHIKYLTFLPHGGCKPENCIPYSKRKHQVAFFGSYNDTTMAEAKVESEKEPWRSLIGTVITRMYEEGRDFVDLMEEEMHFENLQPTEYMRKQLLYDFLYVIVLMRNIMRKHMIEVLGAAGVSVDIYGNGWEDYDNKYSEYLHIHEAVSFEEALEIMSDTKIVLNNLPYADGSHERVFTAMRCGAVALTQENVYFREEFEENREIVFFNYRNLGKLPEKIKFLLDNERLAEHIAESGRRKAENSHTWEMRAKDILKTLQEVKEEQQKQEISCVPVANGYDETFNSLLFFVGISDKDSLYEIMKENFIGYAISQRSNAALLEKSFFNYPYWGRLNIEQGVFECARERTHLLKDREKDFVWLYHRMGDETSRRVLIVLLQNWLDPTANSLNQMPRNGWQQYFDLDLIQFHEDEVFVDCGAYIGDTFIDFALECKSYRNVYCYEFDENNLEELRKIVKDYPNVTVRDCAVGDKDGEISIEEADDHSSSRLKSGGNGRKVPMVTLDSDIKERITFIKADIEGAEKSMLQGAKNHIRNENPKLAIAVYHGNSDILDIPLLIEEMNPDYNFYLRYYGGNLYPNEMILYAL